MAISSMPDYAKISYNSYVAKKSTPVVTKPSMPVVSKPVAPVVFKPVTSAAVYTPSTPVKQVTYTPPKQATPAASSNTATKNLLSNPNVPDAAKKSIQASESKKNVDAILSNPSTPDYAKKSIQASPASTPAISSTYQQVATNNKEAAKSTSNVISSVGSFIVKNGTELLAGAATAVDSNLFFGAVQTSNANKNKPETVAFKVGKVIGDIGSIVAGEASGTVGVAGEVGGLALDATGVGAFAGVALNVASASAIAYGGTVIVKSAANLYNDAKDLVSFAKTSGGSSTGGTNIVQNKAQGKEYEKDVKQDLINSGEKVVTEQITVKTESGKKTVLDFISGDINTGSIKITEAKSSSTAPLTKNQKVAFPEIAETGGTVVGKGKPPFVGGTKIPPTNVEIIRPK